jgi:hypothetical protein
MFESITGAVTAVTTLGGWLTSHPVLDASTYDDQAPAVDSDIFQQWNEDANRFRAYIDDSTKDLESIYSYHLKKVDDTVSGPLSIMAKAAVVRRLNALHDEISKKPHDYDLGDSAFWEAESREWRLTFREIARTVLSSLGRSEEGPMAVGSLYSEEPSTAIPSEDQRRAWQAVRRRIPEELTRKEEPRLNAFEEDIERVKERNDLLKYGLRFDIESPNEE